MRDVLGWRRKFGVIGPSTNTVVQPDFEMMRPVGVTNHYSRIFTPNAQAISNESFMAGINVIGDNVLDAVRSVMTCRPTIWSWACRRSPSAAAWRAPTRSKARSNAKLA